MSFPRPRTLRLDICTDIYDVLENEALNRDIGVPDIVRHIIVEWMAENPPTIPTDEP